MRAERFKKCTLKNDIRGTKKREREKEREKGRERKRGRNIHIEYRYIQVRKLCFGCKDMTQKR